MSGFDSWLFEGQAGQVVIIKAESSDFQVVFDIYTPSYEQYLTSVTEGKTSQLGPIELPETGVYGITAYDYNYQASGSYTLSIEATDAAPTIAFGATDTSSSAALNAVTIGETVEEELVSEDFNSTWSFEGQANQVILITVESNDFLPAIDLFAPDGDTITEFNFDGLSTVQLGPVALPLDGE
ncbi:MAG: hypothetical protein HC898_01355, partial [Phycisphaerales bacterium]|nr:hypothetical protein [Phycisphaerales bacterium]